ncbi:phytoene synthase [Kitasatospora herbaricolor]|uniref:squalene synthase HpnC n=1 Tax=Kitasatospora herbaricolor TaxID=68217 RepID=UPI001997E391|nr:squalene synthase HpnC [Kitasatospora herbaricolor]MDQ0307365.1 squalene synthase HpnC [Kitasatospora herbaricolor]GGV30514.1 phytoene synthase [Kitasatospora herbaricolor]
MTLDKADLENFPVAPFFLPAAWRTDLMAVYGFARLVDDAGDGDLADPAGTARQLDVAAAAPARPAAGAPAGPPAAEETAFRLALLDGLERDLDRVFETALDPASADRPRHPLMRSLVPLVGRHALTPEPFRRLIEANRVDQTTARYPGYQDLIDYCRLSADPVGRLVLSIAGVSTPERIALSDAICTALQIVEHLQDVAEDLARGRIYLPAEDLARFGVTEADLAAPSAGPAVRELVAFEADRARTLLDRGAPLVGTVRGRLRLLLAGFTAGGYAALAAVEAAGYDVLAQQAKPDKRRLAAKAAAIFAKGR